MKRGGLALFVGGRGARREGSSSSSSSSSRCRCSSNSVKLFKSRVITDRKSRFQGFSAVVRSEEEVEAVMTAILAEKGVRSASHPCIRAYRIMAEGQGQGEGQGNFLRKMHNDGEGGGGERILSLLESKNIVNVFVGVTRWYGGKPLGADRFKHISSAAKEALGLLQLKGERKESS